VGKNGSGRESGAEAMGARGGVGHGFEEEGVGCERDGRIVDEALKEADSGYGLDPVAILEVFVAAEVTLAIDQVEGRDSERVDVALDDGWATGQPEENLFGAIVALPDSELDELAQGDVDVGVGVAILKWTVGPGDAIGGEKTHGSVESDLGGLTGALVGQELALICEVKDREGERVFVHGLHGWVVVWIEVTVERGAGKKASDGDGSLCGLGDGGDFGLERCLAQEGEWEEWKKECVGAHVGMIGGG